jgi:hypothetical protein
MDEKQVQLTRKENMAGEVVDKTFDRSPVPVFLVHEADLCELLVT